MIAAIAFTVYPVQDMARARKFYEETLELKVETVCSEQWVEYGVAGQTFAITSIDMKHQPGAKGGAIAFETDDYPKAIARLKEKQATFILDTYETPVCHFAVVADPDGNEVMIHQRKA